jgi:alkylation response protein AidB-like acyl-CoA dehydrogenase
MFIMMNAARFAVGVQGITVSEAAYQKAASYARERIQSQPVDGSSASPVAIIEHPDVRRMLGTMRALTEGARALGRLITTSYGIAKIPTFGHDTHRYMSISFRSSRDGARRCLST